MATAEPEASMVLVEQEVCLISDDAFKPPENYLLTREGQRNMADQEEELVQLAIRQSLMEQLASKHEPQDTQEITLSNRLPQESMPVNILPQSMADTMDPDLELALVLSRAQVDVEQQLRLKEDEELQRVLQLSLQDK